MLRILLCFSVFVFLTACEKKITTTTETKEILNEKHFSIKDSASFVIIEISKPFVGSNIKERYVLYPKGSTSPKVKATHIIATPITDVAINSTTHLGFISNLNKTESISAASNLDLYYDDHFQNLINEGSIHSIGKQQLNQESLISEKVDVLFSYAIDASGMKATEKLRALNQNVILISEYMEHDPLIKAEWLKVFACFYGVKARRHADSIYENVEKQYMRVKDKMTSAPNLPKVMMGFPWKGTWYVSGGDSYQATLINDAGADYLWNKHQTAGSVPLNIETVYSEALNADFWINPGIIQSYDALTSSNEQFKKFKAVKNKKVYSNYKRTNENGANDYWESGVVRPDLILSDLYTILNSDSISTDSLVYYKSIE